MQNKRTMPWKGEKNPYKIWISEIILQQTRVEQGLAYYENFIRLFPNVFTLANAKDEEVFKAWEGLGYYSRCKNLLYTARQIVSEYSGNFPDNYPSLLNLKGIGAYTAAAISSFAYGLPHAVVDGNVLRVLARYFGNSTAIDSTAGKKFFAHLADSLIDATQPAAFNQAIMDFGATVCKPLSPVCFDCPLSSKCVAFATGTINTLPVKDKKLKRKKRFFTYFIFELNGSVYVKKRTGKDIWENLFEFYLLEDTRLKKWTKKSVHNEMQKLGIEQYDLIYISQNNVQQLTHQTISGCFIKIELVTPPTTLDSYTEVDSKTIQLLPFPKFINKHVELQSAMIA